MEINDEGYIRLAIAIVKSAAKEYRQAAKHLCKYPDSKAAKDKISELEEFFLSDWCDLLCQNSATGEYILNKLKKEVASLECEGIPESSVQTTTKTKKHAFKGRRV